jgi:hypothetical protein
MEEVHRRVGVAELQAFVQAFRGLQVVLDPLPDLGEVGLLELRAVPEADHLGQRLRDRPGR